MDTTASRRQLQKSLTQSFGRDSAVGRALNLLYGADITGRDVGNRFSALNMETKLQIWEAQETSMCRRCNCQQDGFLLVTAAAVIPADVQPMPKRVVRCLDVAR